MKKNILADLLLTFMKIGLFTFGGGYAMIAMIENSCVEQKKWISHDDMMNVTVIAESTPGPIAINCATFVGYQQAGFVGALAATLGIVFPSFAIIYAISMFLKQFLEITWIAHAFQGIKIAVGLLILDAAVMMIGKMKKKPFPLSVMIAAAAVMLCKGFLPWKLSSVSLMAISAVISLALFCIQGKNKKKGGAEG